MNTLSVVIITLNEEQHIARCLDSVVPIADEIIVVDSFSTDATEEICSRYDKLTFVKHAWEGYAAQKNYANSLATFGLILSIDADEALSPELVLSINKVKQTDKGGYVYSMNRLMNYCGRWIRHCGWYPDTKIRLFRKNDAYWSGLKVHETLTTVLGVKIKHLDGDMYHYSFNTTEEHKAQIIKFAHLSAEEMNNSKKKTSLLTPYLHACWRFIRDFVFKLGFLDGKTGYEICKINSYGVWCKYKINKEL